MAYRQVDIRRTIPKHPTRRWKKREAVDTIVVHTTASDNQDPNHTAQYHITPGPQNHISTKGSPGLCYHDFITKEGVVYHCNNYEDWTWHAGAYNKRSIGVVMAFRGQDGNPPCSRQMIALEEHLTILCLYIKIVPRNVIGHREIPGMWKLLGNGSKKYKKTCPGMGVSLDRLRQAVTLRLQRRLSAEGLYNGRIDGIWGPKSQAALESFDPKKYFNK